MRLTYYRLDMALLHHRLSRWCESLRHRVPNRWRTLGPPCRLAILCLRHTLASAIWSQFYAYRGIDVSKRAYDRLASWFFREEPKRGAPESDFLIVGHRGAPAVHVENTVRSLEHAIEVEGANALEIDLTLTNDGHVILWHDWEPNSSVALARQLGLEPGVKYMPYLPNLGNTYRRPTHELTLEELRYHYGYKKRFLMLFSKKVNARIPTFDEFVRWSKEHPRIACVFLDIKIPERHVRFVPVMMRTIRATLDRHKATFPVVFLTPHERILNEMKGTAPRECYSLDVELPPGMVLNPGKYSAVQTAIDHGNNYATVGRPLLTLAGWKIYRQLVADDLALLTEHNRRYPDEGIEKLVAWTVNAGVEQKTLLKLGVGGILTDRASRLRRVARKMAKRRVFRKAPLNR